jgi:Bifunctional DNA primase/polymerase, N-terminal
MAEQNMLDAAMRAAAAGLSVVPPREDGSKAPESYWKEFQSRRATSDEIDAWYTDGRDGVGVVTGKISGGLELFEFEGRAVDAGIWDAFQQVSVEVGLGGVLDRVRDGYCEDTPSGGVHLLWRCEEIEGSQKLARCLGDEGTMEVLIETKGEGGYTIVAPSCGRVHPSGGAYQLRSGKFETIATVTPEERAGLLDLARSFNEEKRTKAMNAAALSKSQVCGRPGGNYNASAAWADILEPHGWAHAYRSGDGNEHWRRPGKTLGTSATVSPDGDYLYVFSTSTVFDAERAYNKFGAYTILNHAGDFGAAASALREQGYGDDREVASEVKGKPSQSKLLIDLAVEHYDFAMTPDGRPFAIAKDGPRVARMLRGGKDSMRAELATRFFERYSKAASTAALADAVLIMEGMASRATETVHLRIGPTSGGIVVDLGDDTGRAVVVSADGWHITDRSPVLFERSELTGHLAVPVRGGDIEELRDLLNVDPHSWPLVVGFLVAALVPDIPHPIMALFGEQGTAKTTTVKLCASLIDPSPAQVRTAPRDIEAWVVAAKGSWIVALDNLSRIPEWMSDALCRAVTGEGLVRRQLYTDTGMSVVSFQRSIMITSIDITSLRGDLADRLVPIDLQQIRPDARRTDREIADAWHEACPRILGALLDLTSDVLRVLPNIELAEHPRMADFARILAAIDQVRGLGALDAYLGLADRLAEDVIEGDPVAHAVAQLMEDKATWTGTSGDLLGEITTQDRVPKEWPNSPRALVGALKRVAPALRKVGIGYEHGPRTSKQRLIILTNDQAVSRPGTDLEWHKAREAKASNNDPMTVVTDEPATVIETVIPLHTSDRDEHGDSDGDDGSDGPHPLLSIKEEESRGIDDLIAFFEREFDARVIAERCTTPMAA